MKFTADIEVAHELESEIAVVGGGPGGFAAAVTAARAGRKVLLVERCGLPGGMASIGEVSPFMNNSYYKPGEIPFSLDRRLYLEWINRMRGYLTGRELEKVTEENLYLVSASRLIDKNAAALAVEDMLLEAGVKLLYHHTFFAADVENHRVKRIYVHGKNGLVAVNARVFIDSTGDGDLAAGAGAPFEFGNEDGFCQPMTTCFKVSHVDVTRMPDRGRFNELYDRARAAGEIDCCRENVLWMLSVEPDVIHFNTTRVVKKNPLNPIDFSEAEIDGRRQVREFLRFFRKHVPGFEGARLHSIAAQIGVRESRRILGREYLTVDAFDHAAKCAGAIAQVSYPVDIHNPSGSGTTLRKIAAGDYYEIPYGCIVPRNVDNMLVGSRCISVDHALHSSMRVMPPVVTIGSAAGLAADTAVRTGRAVPDVDALELNRRMKELGIIKA